MGNFSIVLATKLDAVKLKIIDHKLNFKNVELHLENMMPDSDLSTMEEIEETLENLPENSLPPSSASSFVVTSNEGSLSTNSPSF